MKKSIIPILLTSFLVISIAINIYLNQSISGHKSIINSQQAKIDELTQQTIEKTDNQAHLDKCLTMADSKYEQAWNSVCAINNNGDYCDKFVGSPRDIELSLVKNEEKELCLKAFGN